MRRMVSVFRNRLRNTFIACWSNSNSFQKHFDIPFFFSSCRPMACLFQCVSPSFHRSTSVSLAFRDSVTYFPYQSVVCHPRYVFAPFSSSPLYPRCYVLDLTWFPYSVVSRSIPLWFICNSSQCILFSYLQHLHGFCRVRSCFGCIS